MKNDMPTNDDAKRLIDTLSEKEPGAKLDELAKKGFFHETMPPLGKIYDMRGKGYKHPWPHTLQVVDQSRMADEHLKAISDLAKEQNTDESELIDFERLMLTISSLLHDVGKGEVLTGRPGSFSFPKHQFMSEKLAKKLLVSLGFSPQFATSVARDCRLHHSISPERIDAGELEPKERDRISKLSQIEKLMSELTGEDPLNLSPQGAVDLQRRLSIIEADASSLVDWKRDYIAGVRAEIAKAAEQRRLEKEAIKQNTPILDGNELIRIFGLPPGKWIGEAHKLIVEDKKLHPEQNKDRAIRIVRDFLSK